MFGLDVGYAPAWEFSSTPPQGFDRWWREAVVQDIREGESLPHKILRLEEGHF